jgi:hypothetical protein
VSNLVLQHSRYASCSIILLLTAFTSAHAVVAHGQVPRLTYPRPQPAVRAVHDAFDKYPLVAISEGHRNQQVHDFIISLLRDPRFLQKVNDIVVEFGSARYQDVMDRYTAGQTVPPEDLRRVWRETVNILVWDAPVYERFFTTIRAVNQNRLQGARLRILLADPPLDWANVGERSRSPKLEELADSFLYLGPTNSLTESKPPLEIYSDPVYLRELLRRNEIQGGFNTSDLERLRKRFLEGRIQKLWRQP